MTPERLERVEGFYARHGAKAILVGRFVGLVRAVSPFLAGGLRPNVARFLPWSLLGTLLWASAFTLAGYAFSSSFSSAADTLGTHGAFGLAAAAAIVLAIRHHRAPAPQPPLTRLRLRYARCHGRQGQRSDRGS